MSIGAGTPRGQRASAIRTFVIADVRGYTAFSKQHGDEAGARLATTFAEIAREGVEAAGGELTETRGDEILASFDSARRALRAAVELQDAFADEMAIEPSLPLTVGIGIAAGEAVPVGDGFRGRALNLAARLCSKASAGEVLVGEELLGLAGPMDGIELASIEPLELKGFDEPVPVVKVAASSVVAPPAPEWFGERGPRLDLPRELDPAGPIMGRERELRFLRWHWRRARHGHGRGAFVLGPSGMGKTRLVAALAREALAAGAAVRYARCAGPAAEALDVLRGAGGVERPTLVVADDVDVAGGTVLDALEALASSLEARPVLLLGTFREESSPLVAGLVERVDRTGEACLTLPPLTAPDVRAIASVYAGPALAGLPLEELLEETGAIPALVHRAVAQWAAERASARLSASAKRTAAGRGGLGAAESELADNVVELQRARDRQSLYLDEARGAVVCPYKGLATFDVGDADYFCGRERLVATMVAHLVGAQLLGIVGPSGSGKSSAVRAGLVPALRSGVIPGSEDWTVRIMRPALQLDSLDGDGAGRRVLVVDQFEELFTAAISESERAAFVAALTRTVPDRLVVIALRADFYGHCAAFPELAAALGRNHVLVGPMAPDELRRAIELPARRAGLKVERELTDALVTDVGDAPGGLPLLSTALLELWQRREGRTLTLERYRESGGVEGAVARLAEDAYGRLTSEQQSLARAILLRLAGAGEGDSLVRRQAHVSEFEVDRNPDAAHVLSTLTEARLVTVGEDTVEVAHEALLREWPRLRAWLEEDAEGRRLHLQLAHAANEWEEGGRNDADLYRGPRLAAALDWMQGSAVALNRREQEFAEASRASSVRTVERQRRVNRQLRLLLAGAVGLLVVAAIAGAAAFLQQGRAEREADRAALASRLSSARELAASADANLDVDPQRSMLLALEAVRTTRAVDGTVVREAEEALQNAVTAVRPGTPFNGRAGNQIAASPDGSRYVGPGYLGAPGAHSLARVWRTDDRKRLLTLGRDVVYADYGPGGTRIVTAGKGSVATVWDARAGRKVTSVDGGGPLLRAEFGPRDDILATVTTDGLIRVFDLRTGRLLRSLRAWEGPVSRIRSESEKDLLAFDAEGRVLATAVPGGRGALAKVWDLRSGALLGSVAARKNERSVDVALSPDGRVLAVARPNGRLELRDVESGDALYSTSTRTFQLSDVAFSRNGRRLAIAGGDGRVRILDATDGRPLLSLKLSAAYGDRVLIEPPTRSMLEFGPADRSLIASGDLGVVHSWLLDLDRVVGVAHRGLRRALTAEECRQYLHGPCPARPS